jgi:hypothetical protein
MPVAMRGVGTVTSSSLEIEERTTLQLISLRVGE